MVLWGNVVFECHKLGHPSLSHLTQVIIQQGWTLEYQTQYYMNVNLLDNKLKSKSLCGY